MPSTRTARSPIRPEQRPYTAHGAAVAMWRAHDREVLLSGPAGTGKSRANLEKLHFCALKYAGMRGLITRKTRESMSESVLVTFEDHVLPVGSRIAAGANRHTRQAYPYPNGSEIIVSGLTASGRDQRARIMSTEYDLVYVAEAIELLEAEHLMLISRLRNGVMPYQQILGDCNPDSPLHWIWQRQTRGDMLMFHSEHKDNPRLWDRRAQQWTPFGLSYLAKLDALKGPTEDGTVEYQRLRLGKWVQATGVVYDVWADGPADGNVADAAEYVPDGGPVLWACDDGYSGERDQGTGQFTATSHPRVILLCQLKRDGHLDVFAEDYQIKTLSDQQIAAALALPYPFPDYAAHGPGAGEFRGRLLAADLSPRFCSAKVDESVKELHRMIAADANGVRRVRVHPRCKHLRAELASYRRDPVTEVPVKAFDHGPDALRYLAWSVRYE